MATCASCGTASPDGARFCSSCGAAIDAGSGREVRKVVTVLFADVTGSTALGEQLDPESFRRVMARYFDVARGALERHGGTVEKFIGDAVMAVFGVPTVHEDDALRAIRAAADLRDELAALSEELEAEYGVSLVVRTGVNTGEVVTGTEERLAVGDAVNVAARLEQAAEPGEILLGEGTLRLARHAVDVEPVGPLGLKGKAVPVVAHRLLAVEADARAFDRRLDVPLVGRREELATVCGAFDEAVGERRCRLVTVFGPPGIGKSRIAREVERSLAERASVLVGRCLPYGEGITYWPLEEMFRRAGAEAELAEALSAAAPEEVFWSVRKLLERRARERPLAILVEDIHWGEPTLLDLVEHLVDWSRDAPILLLCLARPELLDARPGWAGTHVTLDVLSDDEAGRPIGELLGDAPLDGVARARVRQAAEGNPLFVEQLLAMLAEGGDQNQVPPTIQALLAARLDSLPAAERDLLERASVIGLEFDWSMLTDLAPDGQRPPGTRLASLVRKDLIRPHALVEDAFRFGHLLIRDAAYERLPKELRADLHERLADVVDARGEEFDDIAAYHLEQACRALLALGPPGERARSLAARAAERLAALGRKAIVRGDFPAGAKLLDRAAALLPENDPDRLALLIPLGSALVETGQLDRADAALAEAVERGRAAEAEVVEAEASVALARLRLHTAPLGSRGQESVWKELSRAIPLFRAMGDAGSLSRAHGTAAALHFWRGDITAATRDFERSASNAREAGDRAQEVESIGYILLGLVLGPTPVEEALGRLEKLRERTGRSRVLAATFNRIRAHLEAMAGRFDEARALIGDAKAMAEELGLEAVFVRTALQAGPVEMLAGDPAAAERELRPAYEMLERMGNWGQLTSVAALLAESLVQLGRDDDALRVTQVVEPIAVPEDVDAHMGWRRARAVVLARRGEVDEAERLAREAVALAEGTDYLDDHGKSVAVLAEVLRLAGRADEATAAFDQALALFERKGNAAAARNLRALAPGR